VGTPNNKMSVTKFDKSSGLAKKQIDIIKYAVKKEISRQLPILPEPIETKLFLEGRDAWIFSWSLSKQYHIESKDEITLDVVAKLKKEFHNYNEFTHYKYSCKVKLRQDIYRPKVLIIKKCITNKDKS
jgi:hypothetical protein